MTDAIDVAAARLLEARAGGAPVGAAFMAAHPLSIADGLAVQTRVQAAIGPVGAWKASPASTPEHPKFAPVFARDVHGTTARFAPGRFREPGVECEVAFLIGRDLDRGPYDRDAVMAAIAGLVPLIEIAETRLDDPCRLPTPVEGCAPRRRLSSDGWWLADGLGNGAVLVGAPVTDWRAVETQRLPVTLTFDGTTVATATGNPNDLVGVLQRMVNQAGGHCGGVRAGHVVTFGSLTGNLAAPPGTEAVGRFTGLETLTAVLEG